LEELLRRAVEESRWQLLRERVEEQAVGLVVETDKGGLAVGLGVEKALGWVVETIKGGLSAVSVMERATEWDWTSIAD